MPGKKLSGAILDMDGVITKTAKLHARAWKRLFDDFLQSRAARAGGSYRPFDIDEDYRRYVDGKPRVDGIRSFLESRDIEVPDGEPEDSPDDETIHGLGKRKNGYFHELLEADGVDVWEDTIELIDRCREMGWKVAVFSSSRNCEAVLRAAKVLDRFDAKVDGKDLERLSLPGKPAPDMLLRAAEELGIRPSEAVVLEDSRAGVRAGRAGNFGLVVGVARDRDEGDLRDAGADCVVHDARETLAAISGPPDAPDGPGPPPALEVFGDIAGQLRGKQAALFLDYDGTLTPIVRRPEEATLSEAMRSLLSDLSRHCQLAIVSGRDRRDVENMVQLDELVYAGSHGFDIRGPDGLDMQQKEAEAALPELDSAERQLAADIDQIDGARIERKKFAIAVHYREVAGDEEARQVEQAVDRALKAHSRLRKSSGKKIFELQPDVPWDKGRAVLWLLNALDLKDDRAAVIYIGDDVTDEDAFRALQERKSGTGIGIRVAEAPAETYAAYSLNSCDQVREFLQSLLEVLREK